MNKIWYDIVMKFKENPIFYSMVSIVSLVYFIIFFDEIVRAPSLEKQIILFLILIPVAIFSGYITVALFLWLVIYPLSWFLVPLFSIFEDIFKKKK